MGIVMWLITGLIVGSFAGFVLVRRTTSWCPECGGAKCCPACYRWRFTTTGDGLPVAGGRLADPGPDTAPSAV